jgi:S-adenosylmethionine decarboxylase proenzyme
MKVLGRHLIVELVDCDRALLDDLDTLEQALTRAVEVSGATIVRSVFHRYAPQGVSGVVVIAESHMSVHTWPEYGYAALDFFTCGESVSPHRAFDHMKAALDAGGASVTEVRRGMPSAVDEIIPHKQTEPAAGVVVPL